ncbi:MAG: DUF5312 family protein [Treponema sp.]|nr:DUF5312 family protein [Treponema sp.]
MGKGNFFQDILASIFNSSNSEVLKRRMLKKAAKDLSKSKYHFYKYGSHEVDVSFAKFFYEIYKAISPAQLMFANANQNSLKNIVINLSLSEDQKTLIDDLSEESLRQNAASMSLQELSHKVNAMLEKFNAELTRDKITRTDSLYTKFILFKNFCQYDFFFLLKKFDSSLRERSFNSTPRFQPIGGSYVVEDIKNFTSIAWSIPLDSDWEDVFNLLKSLKGVEPIALNTWKKILMRLKSVREYNIFELMIQLITEDPGYRENYKTEEYHIMDDFILEIRKTAEATLEQLQSEQRAGKVDNLLSEIFESSSVEPLHYYNEETSSVYENKKLLSLTYAAPLSYLRSFLLDYVKKDVRELSDILLVRAEWSSQQLAKPMSEAYHQMIEFSSEITALDEKFSDSGEFGSKIKMLLPRVERDREGKNIAKMVINDANNEAARIILASRQNFVAYAKNLKMLLEDFVKQPRSELIRNWKALDTFAEGNLKQKCIDVYKKLFAFVSLLQNFDIEISDLN